MGGTGVALVLVVDSTGLEMVEEGCTVLQIVAWGPSFYWSPLLELAND